MLFMQLFRDLGFVSRPDGKFDVYCAGGMGANPRMGVKIAEKNRRNSGSLLC